jgi:D-amino-acid oxidase
MPPSGPPPSTPTPPTGADPVTVVGAGVVGLTCALRLADTGRDVRVVARDRLTATTSSVAAAIWFPYRAYPFDRVLAWSQVAYGEFVRLAAEDPAAGVVVRPGMELQRGDDAEPWWATAVPGLERVVDVPDGYACGWRCVAPVIDMSRYLPWLEAHLARRGVDVLAGEVADLGALARLAPPGGVVVNATGLGSRTLVPDPEVTPVRGQVVLVEQDGVEEWLGDAGEGHPLVYVVPRIDDVVVGGTAQEGDDDRTVDPATADDILRRATRLVPALAGARVIGHKVGLRPARPAVRLEPEQVTAPDGRDRTVVHCYGHGGAGVTMSWGCAAEVVDLVRSAV